MAAHPIVAVQSSHGRVTAHVVQDSLLEMLERRQAQLVSDGVA